MKNDIIHINDIMQPMKKGCYLLLMELKKNQYISIAKTGKHFFKKGHYVYVGSALNGLQQRIHRHLRTQKKMYWHIDFFLSKAIIKKVFFQESTTKKECDIAQVFEKNCQSFAGFGCSDCSCTSHLFTGSLPQLISLMNRLKMTEWDNAKF